MNTQNAANAKRTDQSGRDARRRISPTPCSAGWMTRTLEIGDGARFFHRSTAGEDAPASRGWGFGKNPSRHKRTPGHHRPRAASPGGSQDENFGDR